MPPRLRSIRLQIGSQPSRLVIFAANRFEPSGIPTKPAMHSDSKPATCSLRRKIRIDDVLPFLIGQEGADFTRTNGSCAGLLRPDRSVVNDAVGDCVGEDWEPDHVLTAVDGKRAGDDERSVGSAIGSRHGNCFRRARSCRLGTAARDLIERPSSKRRKLLTLAVGACVRRGNIIIDYIIRSDIIVTI